jgi:hypothetical protein
LQNFPVLSGALLGASTGIAGSLNSLPNTTFIVDFYASAAADPSGSGEGQRYLGSTTVATDGSGNVSFSLFLAAATATGEVITATATDPNGNTSEFSAVVGTRAPATVQSVVINDGGVQRSMVTSLTVTFSGIVTIDSGAFEVRKQGGGLANLNLATSVVSGRTVVVVTFSGAGIVGGSLADGNYTLTILSNRVHDDLGFDLDGDANGTVGGNRVDAFFRFFGDSDGDRDVDVHDLVRFLSTLGKRRGDSHFLWYFDYDSDGNVGLEDAYQFALRLGRRLAP